MRIRQIGLAYIGLAVACAIIERLFFSGVDDNGVQQVSFFLPLAWGFGGAGGALLIGAGVARVRRALKRKMKTRS